ncbi:uncharacterized protein G2W53_014333 [Senna tora]|uniref:Uncharacterized protein n=1 Tax=Senna tora TaxID=362788 RepID=A0A834WTB3_9FABA|nr:uncharacterized protein G2W53_014333 [Senna tora]
MSFRVVFANRCGFDAPIEVVLAWEERGSCLNIFRMTNHVRIFVTFRNCEPKDLLRKSMDHFLTYSGRQITVKSQKPSRITRQKTCCVSESNTSVRVVFANRSGFDGAIGVALAWEERGSCLNIFRMKNRGRNSETFMNSEAKDLLSNESNTSVRDVFANRSGFDAPMTLVLAWEERGSCLNIFQMTNHGRISETFTNYEGKDLLSKNLHELRRKRLVAQVSQTHRFALYFQTGVVLMLQLESSWHGRSVNHVLTYSGRKIVVGSKKPSRITRQETCCASESNTSVRVVFANRSGFDAPIEVVLAWEERGSCLKIFRMTNRVRIPVTFRNYEAKDLLRNESKTSVRIVFGNRSGFDAPIGVVLAWEERGSCLNIFTVGSQKPSRITRQKTCCACESNTSVDVVFANQSGFHAPIGVVLAWEERGSCLNKFWTTNHRRISETITNYVAKELLRKSVDHVLTYSERQIVIGSQKNSRITRQKTCSASEVNTSIRVVFANWSCFDAPIGVVLAWEERGSCLNIFRTTNRDRILKTFMNYEAKDLLPSESSMSVRVVFANRSGIDAPIGVILAWEERGSCLNIFWTTNRGCISETFTNYEAKDLLRKSVDHVLTYFGSQIMVGSQKPSRITRQKTCCASESSTSVRVVFANRSVFDAPIGVVLAWEERGSCLNIFRTKNCDQISETFTNYEAKDLLRNQISETLKNYEVKALLCK